MSEYDHLLKKVTMVEERVGGTAPNSDPYTIKYILGGLRREIEKLPHPSHSMSEWHAEIRAPAGTARFYGVRTCVLCGAEEARHPAGHFGYKKLTKPCTCQPNE